jgi:predicted membrane protein
LSAGSAVRALRNRAGESATKRIGWLFMVGSALFALASVPGASSLCPEATGIIYFTGSIFFTTAATEQLRTVRGGERLDLLASAVQLAGTLLFNLSTFDGMLDSLSAKQEDLLVWAPDTFGSACFLVASGVALAAVWRVRFFAPARRVARLNLIGSLAFGASAIAAWVVPDTGELLDASVATSWTLVGALSFLAGAHVLAARVSS